MSSAQPFPRLLRWALVAAVGMFAVAILSHKLLGGAKHFVAGLWMAGGLTALVAVPAAVFLMLRDGHYVCARNIVLTLLATIPMAMVIFLAMALGFGHYHI